MAITNTEAIKFVNEEIRQTAEEMRALYYKCKAINLLWFNGINTIITNSVEEAIEDNREAEGVSRLTGEDVNNLMNQIGIFITACEGSGVLNIIQKPCVRSLRIE